MGKAQWIWHKNELVYYLYKKVMHKRVERSKPVISQWKVDGVYECISFAKECECEEDIALKIRAGGKIAIRIDGNPHYADTKDGMFPLGKGKHYVCVDVFCENGFPCLYVEGGPFDSDGNWKTNCGDYEWLPADYGGFYEPESRPDMFTLPVRELHPAVVKKTNGGTLYDFGKELFAFPVFCGISGDGVLNVGYGESEEEAVDLPECILCDVLEISEETEKFPSQENKGFRYIFIPNGAVRVADVYCMEEYYPVKNRAYFKSNDELLNRIYDISAYTLELTSREFYLDGVKRDRWPWAGDAYQSMLMGLYTYFDKDIIKRTIIGLLGKEKTVIHINKILDYSLYLIIMTGIYDFYADDADFVSWNYGKLKELMEFCLSRRSKDGFMRGKPGEMVFIDHSVMNRDGALAVIQILLAEALKTMAGLAKIAGQVGDVRRYGRIEKSLRLKIQEKFWDRKSGRFLHDDVGGMETRYAGLFALLYHATGEVEKAGVKEMLCGDSVQSIVTPYMKFFELAGLCECGEIEKSFAFIKEYWGGMAKENATTFWEKFIPEETGIEKNAMYGRKYGKSLCHSWGAGPLYLVGRYLVGLKPAKKGYLKFELTPYLDGRTYFEAELPANMGSVYVKYKAGQLTVKAEGTEGSLRLPGRADTEILPGKNYSFVI